MFEPREALNFNILFDIELLFGFILCLLYALPLLKSMCSLMRNFQLQDTFACDFVSTIKAYPGTYMGCT
jgi:hypothetical protein